MEVLGVSFHINEGIVSKKPSFESSRAARVAAVQALFQIEHQKADPKTVADEFLLYRFRTSDYPTRPHTDLFLALIGAATDRRDDIFSIIEHNLDEKYRIDRMEPVLISILTVGIAELLAKPAPVPLPVIISEYVDITKGFYEGNEPSYVNYVLDHIAKSQTQF
ncbi:MAG: transcription antitermination factor NusB [Caedimonadaceae bacterium]|nr:MAG: transcription antitermination factor NusB [Caedimonadaceae bacterium]